MNHMVLHGLYWKNIGIMIYDDGRISGESWDNHGNDGIIWLEYWENSVGESWDIGIDG